MAFGKRKRTRSAAPSSRNDAVTASNAAALEAKAAAAAAGAGAGAAAAAKDDVDDGKPKPFQPTMIGKALPDKKVRLGGGSAVKQMKASLGGDGGGGGGGDGPPLTAMQKRMAALKARIRAGQAANKEAAQVEYQKQREPSMGAKAAAAAREAEKDKEEEAASRPPRPRARAGAGAGAGVDLPAYMSEAAEDAEAAKVAELKKKKRIAGSYGWNVFNETSKHRAYKKRLAELPGAVEGGGSGQTVDQVWEAEDDEDNNPLGLYGSNDAVVPGGVDRMVAFVEAADKRRANFSRRRAVNPHETVDYINERNRNFNKKVERTLGKYTVETKQALEMGTNL